MNKKSEKELF